MLKIARDFVSRRSARSRPRALAAAIVGARALPACVVAEGIEEPEQADRLRALGCDLGQGFLLLEEPVDAAPVSRRCWRLTSRVNRGGRPPGGS